MAANIFTLDEQDAIETQAVEADLRRRLLFWRTKRTCLQSDIEWIVLPGDPGVAWSLDLTGCERQAAARIRESVQKAVQEAQNMVDLLTAQLREMTPASSDTAYELVK